MFEEVTGRAEEQDIIIKAAAVADYRPRYVSDEKVKKKDDDLALEMERTDDILAYLGAHKTKDQFLCGFSMETENVIANSKDKLIKKNMDMIVAKIVSGANCSKLKHFAICHIVVLHASNSSFYGSYFALLTIHPPAPTAQRLPHGFSGGIYSVPLPVIIPVAKLWR